MNIGEMKEICFHKDNVVIPSGYLECDGRSITEDEYPELFFHLTNGDDTEEVFLPVIDDVEIDDKLILKKLISYKEQINTSVNYDGEFTTNTVKGRSFNRRDICMIRKQK
jgi:hypothetical protein